MRSLSLRAPQPLGATPIAAPICTSIPAALKSVSALGDSTNILQQPAVAGLMKPKAVTAAAMPSALSALTLSHLIGNPTCGSLQNNHSLGAIHDSIAASSAPMIVASAMVMSPRSPAAAASTAMSIEMLPSPVRRSVQKLRRASSASAAAAVAAAPSTPSAAASVAAVPIVSDRRSPCAESTAVYLTNFYQQITNLFSSTPTIRSTLSLSLHAPHTYRIPLQKLILVVSPRSNTVVSSPAKSRFASPSALAQPSSAAASSSSQSRLLPELPTASSTARKSTTPSSAAAPAVAAARSAYIPIDASPSESTLVANTLFNSRMLGSAVKPALSLAPALPSVTHRQPFVSVPVGLPPSRAPPASLAGGDPVSVVVPPAPGQSQLMRLGGVCIPTPVRNAIKARRVSFGAGCIKLIETRFDTSPQKLEQALPIASPPPAPAPSSSFRSGCPVGTNDDVESADCSSSSSSGSFQWLLFDDAAPSSSVSSFASLIGASATGEAAVCVPPPALALGMDGSLLVGQPAAAAGEFGGAEAGAIAAISTLLAQTAAAASVAAAPVTKPRGPVMGFSMGAVAAAAAASVARRAAAAAGLSTDASNTVVSSSSSAADSAAAVALSSSAAVAQSLPRASSRPATGAAPRHIVSAVVGGLPAELVAAIAARRRRISGSGAPTTELADGCSGSRAATTAPSSSSSTSTSQGNVGSLTASASATAAASQITQPMASGGSLGGVSVQRSSGVGMPTPIRRAILAKRRVSPVAGGTAVIDSADATAAAGYPRGGITVTPSATALPAFASSTLSSVHLAYRGHSVPTAAAAAGGGLPNVLYAALLARRRRVSMGPGSPATQTLQRGAGASAPPTTSLLMRLKPAASASARAPTPTSSSCDSSFEQSPSCRFTMIAAAPTTAAIVDASTAPPSPSRIAPTPTRAPQMTVTAPGAIGRSPSLAEKAALEGAAAVGRVADPAAESAGGPAAVITPVLAHTLLLNTPGATSRLRDNGVISTPTAGAAAGSTAVAPITPSSSPAASPGADGVDADAGGAAPADADGEGALEVDEEELIEALAEWCDELDNNADASDGAAISAVEAAAADVEALLLPSGSRRSSYGGSSSSIRIRFAAATDDDLDLGIVCGSQLRHVALFTESSTPGANRSNSDAAAESSTSVDPLRFPLTPNVEDIVTSASLSVVATTDMESTAAVLNGTADVPPPVSSKSPAATSATTTTANLVAATSVHEDCGMVTQATHSNTAVPAVTATNDTPADTRSSSSSSGIISPAAAAAATAGTPASSVRRRRLRSGEYSASQTMAPASPSLLQQSSSSNSGGTATGESARKRRSVTPITAAAATAAATVVESDVTPAVPAATAVESASNGSSTRKLRRRSSGGSVPTAVVSTSTSIGTTAASATPSKSTAAPRINDADATAAVSSVGIHSACWDFVYGIDAAADTEDEGSNSTSAIVMRTHGGIAAVDTGDEEAVRTQCQSAASAPGPATSNDGIADQIYGVDTAAAAAVSELSTVAATAGAAGIITTTTAAVPRFSAADIPSTSSPNDNSIVSAAASAAVAAMAPAAFASTAPAAVEEDSPLPPSPGAWDAEADPRYHRRHASVLYSNAGARLSTVFEMDEEEEEARAALLREVLPAASCDTSMLMGDEEEHSRRLSTAVAGAAAGTAASSAARKRRQTVTPQKRRGSGSVASSALSDASDEYSSDDCGGVGVAAASSSSSSLSTPRRSSATAAAAAAGTAASAVSDRSPATGAAARSGAGRRRKIETTATAISAPAAAAGEDPAASSESAGAAASVERRGGIRGTAAPRGGRRRHATHESPLDTPASAAVGTPGVSTTTPEAAAASSSSTGVEFVGSSGGKRGVAHSRRGGQHDDGDEEGVVDVAPAPHLHARKGVGSKAAAAAEPAHPSSSDASAHTASLKPRPAHGKAPTATAAAAAEEQSDEEGCRVCGGMTNRKGNYMLLCDGTCGGAYHQKCAGATGPVPEGDWLCPSCVYSAAAPASPPLAVGAEDGASSLDWATMTVKELREALGSRGLDSSGLKAALVRRLVEADAAAAAHLRAESRPKRARK